MANRFMARKYGYEEWIRIGLWVGALVLMAIVIFGFFAPINGAIIAPGIVSTEYDRIKIQHLEGGIVEEIYVKDGSVVLKGDKLIKIASTGQSAKNDIFKSRRIILLATEARLKAESAMKDKIEYPAEISSAADADDKGIENSISANQNLFHERYTNLQNSINVSQNNMHHLTQHISNLSSQEAKLSIQISSASADLKSIRHLSASGAVAQSRVGEAARLLTTLQNQRSDIQSQISKARDDLKSLKLEQDNLTKDYVSRALGELSGIHRELIEVTETIKATSDENQRTIISAPEDGTIMNLKISGTSEVIKSGDTVMDLVPAHKDLMINIKISPMDIDLAVYDSVVFVKLNAYRSKKIPMLNGRLTYISPDIIKSPETGETYYMGKVVIDASEFLKLHGYAMIKTGMPVTAFIQTGSRTFFSYLTKPISESMYLSFRDE